ncbi:MAG: DMT family transporter [Flavobacteriales bacterium]|nr:DMT family transporter [Flavobacteriales bacterium]
MNLKLDTPLKQFLTLIALATIWGSSFILMKRGLDSFSAENVAQYRLFVSFLCLLPIAWVNRKSFPRKRRYVGGLIIVGLFGNLMPAFLFAVAQTKLPSGVAGMINSLVPIFTLLIGVFVFRLKPVIYQVIGVFIGFIGAVLLIYGSQSSVYQDVPMAYPLMIVAATVCYAISVNTIKHVLTDLPALQITSFSFLLIGPFVTYGLVDRGFWTTALSTTQGLQSLGYITLLGFLGTAIALLIFNQLIKYSSALFASSVTYMIPIVATVWGLLDGEQFSIWHALGMISILLGVYMVNVYSKRRENHSMGAHKKT